MDLQQQGDQIAEALRKSQWLRGFSIECASHDGSEWIIYDRNIHCGGFFYDEEKRWWCRSDVRMAYDKSNRLYYFPCEAAARHAVRCAWIETEAIRWNIAYPNNPKQVGVFS